MKLASELPRENQSHSMATESKKRKFDDEKSTLHVDDLPNDVFYEIFKNLAMRTFIRCRMVSVMIRRATRDS